jgi:hypothetical protein
VSGLIHICKQFQDYCPAFHLMTHTLLCGEDSYSDCPYFISEEGQCCSPLYIKALGLNVKS